MYIFPIPVHMHTHTHTDQLEESRQVLLSSDLAGLKPSRRRAPLFFFVDTIRYRNLDQGNG